MMEPAGRFEGCTVHFGQAYGVYEDSDKIEGRGRRFLSGLFLDRALAVEGAKGKGVFGGDGEVRPVIALVIAFPDGACLLSPWTGQFYEHPPAPPSGAVLAKALAKLDQAERDALAGHFRRQG